MDHYGPGETDHIKNPAGWMISMLRRVAKGEAHLAKSLFGIVCSDPVLSKPRAVACDGFVVGCDEL